MPMLIQLEHKKPLSSLCLSVLLLAPLVERHVHPQHLQADSVSPGFTAVHTAYAFSEQGCVYDPGRKSSIEGVKQEQLTPDCRSVGLGLRLI